MSTQDEDRAARGGSARYGNAGQGSGANEPKGHERKEQHENWVPRQGGDQTRTGEGEHPRRGEDDADDG